MSTPNAGASRPDVRLASLYGLIIFLGAFLLFQVQPIIGKMILPWFGGSASVWTTCLLFFQSLLLLGYLYSHWLVRFLRPRNQSLLHIGLLAVSLLLLPLSPSAAWRPTGVEEPTARILGLLTVSIGLPYFVLSTTGPLIQAWFARERPGAVPYRLFALSNFGSLLALLAYPVVVEPLLPTRVQSYTWSALFLCFAVLCAALAWRARHSERPNPISGHEGAHEAGRAGPGFHTRLLWVALACCPSILLLADTSYLTQNIAPIPLLWVVTLALYLLSFILCFERERWYRRWLFLPLLVVALGAMAYIPTLGLSAIPLRIAVAINLSSFFAVCMVCHGELARTQPHPDHLTRYYLMIATGGAIGGLFVGVVAPNLFNSDYELSAGLVLTALVVSTVLLRGRRFSRKVWKPIGWLAAGAMTVAIFYVRAHEHATDLQGARLTARNFYGTLQVADGGIAETAYRTLTHGQIIHGRQFLSPDRQDWPTTYYGEDSGAGLALTVKGERGSLRVGVIGLGAGTLLAYGRRGDTYRVYDINPLVIDLARSQFTFLRRTQAHTDLVLGDARLSLEREGSQQFDVLLVDAFSGDAVPIHLLTQEAFATYFRHLKPDGVLAVHVSNRFLDLAPVVKAAAMHFGKQAMLEENEQDDDRSVYSSSWVLVTGDTRFFEHETIEGTFEDIDIEPGFRVWRDDYSSVFAVLK